MIGEAFESVDASSCISFSSDGGKTWGSPKAMFDKSGYPCSVSESCKVVSLKDGRLAAIGYAYLRKDPELPVGNPETGGLLEDFIFWSVSEDEGKTWSAMTPVACAWGPHAEASAPLTVLDDGSWVTPITGFLTWEGNMTGPMCGRLLRTEDEGKTWEDSAICMEFGGQPVTCYEQRMCQLDSGGLVCIGWNENTETGERLDNHYTFSCDRGKTWSSPVSTGVRGQASSVCALGGDRLLALHAVRRDTDRPGIYGYVVDFSHHSWDIRDRMLIWEPETPVVKDDKMAEVFAYLKFGQPGAIRTRDGKILMSHWYAQDGQYKTVCTRIEI